MSKKAPLLFNPDPPRHLPIDPDPFPHPQPLPALNCSHLPASGLAHLFHNLDWSRLRRSTFAYCLSDQVKS